MDQHKEIYNKAREKLIINFQKYRGYYDRKAKAAPLEKDDFCFLLHPKITKHNDIMAIVECKWLGLFKVVKKLTHSKNLVRKVNTNLTQVVHRIRLRKYVPPAQPVDICISNHTQFEADTSDPDTLEPLLFDIDKIDEDSDLFTQSDRSDPIVPEPEMTREQTNWLDVVSSATSVASAPGSSLLHMTIGWASSFPLRDSTDTTQVTREQTQMLTFNGVDHG